MWDENPRILERVTRKQVTAALLICAALVPAVWMWPPLAPISILAICVLVVAIASVLWLPYAALLWLITAPVFKMISAGLRVLHAFVVKR